MRARKAEEKLWAMGRARVAKRQVCTSLFQSSGVNSQYGDSAWLPLYLVTWGTSKIHFFPMILM